MVAISLLPVFIVGLLGSVHCVGMCGGIVGAFSMTGPTKPFPVTVVAIQARAQPSTIARVMSYNLGRIGSYALAGAIAGGLTRGALALANMAALQLAAYWMANLMLIALGLYLTGVWHGLARLESAGQVVWQRMLPLAKALMPLDNPYRLILAGAIWGWLPCGMVYSMLFSALLSGSAVSGAAVMAVFGLGTLPTLLAMGMFGGVLRNWVRRKGVRLACGAIVIGYGALGLAHALQASGDVHAGWLDSFCVSPVKGLSWIR